MSQRAGGEGLDGDSRAQECPGLAQSIDNRGRIVGTAVGMEKTALRFQNLFRCGPANRSEVGCNHARFRSMARLKRFRHCAKVFTQPGRMARGNSECPRGSYYVQPFSLVQAAAPRRLRKCRWSGIHLRSGAARSLPRSCILPRPRVVGDQQIPSALHFDLGCRQSCGKHADRGVDEQPIHTVFAAASCVSSKSSTWIATPLAKAAKRAGS